MGALLALAIGGVAVAQSLCDQISFSTTTGTPGAAVNVYGDAYSDTDVTILWDGAAIASSTTDQYGNFSVDFTVPADAAAGEHEVIVRFTGEGSDDCPTPFVVEALAEAPAAAAPSGSKPLAKLPETGFALIPSGALLVAGFSLLLARKKRS
ncbi:MAG: hypothetical protein C4534_10085 [Gaiellales bacterium]|nr:MAG: hypothetical protein C4534_10085 [Gaiellales bacterium]